MRKLRKKKNNKKIILLFIILMVSTVFITTGYAILRQSQQITGTANIKGKSGTSNNEFDVTPTVKDSWYDNSFYGYNISLLISNNTNYKTNGWEVSIDVPSDVSNINCWVSNYSISNGRLIFTNLDYNGKIEPDSSTELGFILSTATPNYKPSNIIIKIFTDEYPDGIEYKIKNNNSTTSESSESGNENKTDTDTNTDIFKESEENDNNYSAGPFDVNFDVVASWPSGDLYITQYTVTLSNSTDKDISSWKFDIVDLDNFEFDTVWNANYIKGDSALTLSNVSYNSIIKASDSITFTLQLKSNTQNYKPNIANRIYTN